MAGENGAATDTSADDTALPGLADELGELFDLSEVDDDSTPGKDDQVSADEKGKTNTPGDDQVSGDTDAAGEADESLSITAPASWNNENKEMFLTLPDEVQQQIAARESERETQINRVLEENADVNKAFEPYEEQMRLAGMSKGPLLERLLNAQAYLMQSPVEAVAWLSNAYIKDEKAASVIIRHLSDKFEIDIDSLETDDTDTDPEVVELRKQIDGLNQRLNKQDTDATDSTNQGFYDEISAMEDAKNDDGSIKFPHFIKASEHSNEIRTTMAGLIQYAPSDMSYEQAYAKAIKTLGLPAGKTNGKSKPDESEADMKKRVKKEAIDAKRRRLPGTGTTDTGSAKPATLNDEIAELYDGA